VSEESFQAQAVNLRQPPHARPTKVAKGRMIDSNEHSKHSRVGHYLGILARLAWPSNTLEAIA